MKKLIITVLAVLAMAVTVFAQGKAPRFSDGGEPIDGMATRSITKYSQAAGSTKITVPLASSVSKFCVQPTAASGLRVGTASGFSGDQKAIAANAELCRGVAKGVTQLQYSSTTSGTAVFEFQNQN